jgi:hypothetical protein
MYTLGGLSCGQFQSTQLWKYFDLKGQSKRFLAPIFFIKWLFLVPIVITPKSDLKFCQIFVELFVFEIPKNQLSAIIDSEE